MKLLPRPSARSARFFVFAVALAAFSAQAAIQTMLRTSAGTIAQGGTWTNANSAASINGSCALGDGSTSSSLTLTNWGFTVPAAATILGVTVRSVSSFNDASTQDQIRLVKAGVAAGTAKALNDDGSISIPGCSDPIGGGSGLTVGGGSDLWGTTLTVAQVNATGFGVFYDNNFANTAVDGVAITVTYQDNVTATVTPSAGAGGSISPNTPQDIITGTTTTFTVTPNVGYSASVGGTCGGNLVGTTYTTHTINGDCTVVASFTALPDVVTDLDGDGHSDILYRNSSTGQVYRLLMNSLAISDGAFAYNEPNTAWKIVADADFNGDGITDLLYRNDVTGQVFMILFNVNGMPASSALVNTEPNLNWKIVGAPDLNGDGKADILYRNSATGQVYALLMNGFSLVGQGIVYNEPNLAWQIAAVADFSGTGKQNQLLYRNTGTGQVFMLTVTYSSGNFSVTGAFVYYEPNLAWKIVGAGDFDGNSKDDILWRNDSTGQVFMLLMNGTTVASSGLVYTEPNLAWKIVALGDYNGNGRSDLLWRNDSTGQVYLMQMNGLAIGTQGLVYTEANTAWKILGPTEYAAQLP